VAGGYREEDERRQVKSSGDPARKRRTVQLDKTKFLWRGKPVKKTRDGNPGQEKRKAAPNAAEQ